MVTIAVDLFACSRPLPVTPPLHYVPLCCDIGCGLFMVQEMLVFEPLFFRLWRRHDDSSWNIAMSVCSRALVVEKSGKAKWLGKMGICSTNRKAVIMCQWVEVVSASYTGLPHAVRHACAMCCTRQVPNRDPNQLQGRHSHTAGYETPLKRGVCEMPCAAINSSQPSGTFS